MELFDIEKSYDFIRRHVGEEISSHYSDDQLNVFLDVLLDACDKFDLDVFELEDDLLTPALEAESQKITEEVLTVLVQEPGFPFDRDEVLALIAAERAYEDSLF